MPYRGPSPASPPHCGVPPPPHPPTHPSTHTRRALPRSPTHLPPKPVAQGGTSAISGGASSDAETASLLAFADLALQGRLTASHGHGTGGARRPPGLDLVLLQQKMHAAR